MSLLLPSFFPPFLTHSKPCIQSVLQGFVVLLSGQKLFKYDQWLGEQHKIRTSNPQM